MKKKLIKNLYLNEKSFLLIISFEIYPKFIIKINNQFTSKSSFQSR